MTGLVLTDILQLYGGGWIHHIFCHLMRTGIVECTGTALPNVFCVNALLVGPKRIPTGISYQLREVHPTRKSPPN